MKKLIVDGNAIIFNEGDSALVAMLRADIHPRDGGCLCLGGDCPHCVARVDGVSYVRTCHVEARPGMLIECEHKNNIPPPVREPIGTNHQRPTPIQHVYCDVLVVGQGRSGKAAAQVARSANKNVITLDTCLGEEAVGIYAGPLVVARSRRGMMHVHPRDEIVIATGSAEIQPVALGNHLKGLLTKRAFEELVERGVDLGRVVAIGNAPCHAVTQTVEGHITEFHGDSTVRSVTVKHGERIVKTSPTRRVFEHP